MVFAKPLVEIYVNADAHASYAGKSVNPVYVEKNNKKVLTF